MHDILPSFLKPYQQDLKKYERKFIRITPTPLTNNPLDDELALTQSKFLGKPFFPISKQYPIDKKDKPIIMFAQLNFSAIPSLKDFPTEGIF